MARFLPICLIATAALDGKPLDCEPMPMHRHMLIFGMGYTASRLADSLRESGWHVTGTRRMSGGDAIAFDDEAAVSAAIENATHILSSVPPNGEGGDPVLLKYGDRIAGGDASWLGYLSSTGVYGDTGGAWVDESGAIGEGRRTARADADLAWQALRNACHARSASARAVRRPSPIAALSSTHAPPVSPYTPVEDK